MKSTTRIPTAPTAATAPYCQDAVAFSEVLGDVYMDERGGTWHTQLSIAADDDSDYALLDLTRRDDTTGRLPCDEERRHGENRINVQVPASGLDGIVDAIAYVVRTAHERGMLPPVAPVAPVGADA